MNETEPIKAGKIRLQIYTMVREITGRDLTDQEHAMLKAILQDFKNTVAPTIKDAPTEHTYTCKGCGGKKHGSGTKFTHKMNRIKPPKGE